MELKINFNINPENYYTDNKNKKRNNHIIPKVYYKQWVSKNNTKLKIETSDGEIRFKNINKYNKEKYAFVIRFGDTYLPEIVKERIKNIIDSNEFSFFCDDKECTDVEKISDNYYLIGKWSVFKSTGQKIKENTFASKISEADCYAIEIGLDKVFENNYLSVIKYIDEIFNNNQKELLDGQLLFYYILRAYLCFYLRSDAWYDLAIKNSKSIINEINKKKIIKDDNNLNKIREKVIVDLRKKYLWELLYDYDSFKIYFEPIYKALQNKNLIIYRNLTEKRFVTSKMPVCNIQGIGSAFIMSPIYLAKLIDDVGATENRVYFADLIDLDYIESLNADIKNINKEIVLYNS